MLIPGHANKGKKIMRSTLSVLLLPLLVTVMVVASLGCDSAGSNDSILNNETGRFRLLLTDAPFPFDLVESTIVWITRIELVASPDTVDKMVISTDTMEFNLLDLQNGVTATLVDTLLPAGDYSQMRLFVEEARIILKDSTQFALKIPGGSSSGLKILLSGLTIAPDSMTVMTLDFDISESFVVQGNPSTPAGINGFIFKPVIKPIGFAAVDTTQG